MASVETHPKEIKTLLNLVISNELALHVLQTIFLVSQKSKILHSVDSDYVLNGMFFMEN